MRTIVMKNKDFFKNIALSLTILVSLISIYEFYIHLFPQHIGLTISEINAELAGKYNLETVNGALITKIAPNSVADRYDLREYDIIVKINGTDINKNNISIIGDIVKESSSFTPIIIGINRGGTLFDVTIFKLGGI